MEGQFSVRGGILDVFPAEGAKPVRIELLGDTVESLREFDPETQRSTGPVRRVVLPPLTEFPLGVDGRDGGHSDLSFSRVEGPETAGARLVSLFDLREGTLVVLDEPEDVAQRAAKSRDRLMADRASLGTEDVAIPLVLPEDQWKKALDDRQRLSLEELALRRGESEPRTLKVQPTSRYHGQIQAFLGEIRGRLSAGEEVLIAAASSGEVERLADLCREYEVPYRLGELGQSATGTRLVEEVTSGSAPAAVLLRAPLTEGFVIPEAKLAFYGTGDLFETVPVHERPRARPKTAGFFSDFSELKAGDYVVHVDHVIGQFEGLHTIETEGRRGEFICACNMRMKRGSIFRWNAWTWCRAIARWRAQEACNWIGWAGPAWVARKPRDAEIADGPCGQIACWRLLPGERRRQRGWLPFRHDVPWQREFEDAFEFFRNARSGNWPSADIKRDMEASAPMDRLLCGDVGYGKTEVAMRAAFKAVANSKQVAVLAPTTVFWSFSTTRRHFGGAWRCIPCASTCLSRIFCSTREQNETLAAVEEEEGGHSNRFAHTSCFPATSRFHDLGLLIAR